MVARKRDVVAAALARTKGESDPLRLLALVGGPEIALLAGVTLGAGAAGAPVVLDGLAASLPGVIAVRRPHPLTTESAWAKSSRHGSAWANSGHRGAGPAFGRSVRVSSRWARGEWPNHRLQLRVNVLCSE